MKIRLTLVLFFLFCAVIPANGGETDYLALLAEESEIKAIATVAQVNKMSRNADGTFTRVTFKRVYALSSFTPKTFVGGCKIYEYSWQKRSKDMVYFKPRKDQRVFVTITTNGGAITSYTPLTPELDHVVRKEPYRIAYHHGRASITYTE